MNSESAFSVESLDTKKPEVSQFAFQPTPGLEADSQDPAMPHKPARSRRQKRSWKKFLGLGLIVLILLIGTFGLLGAYTFSVVADLRQQATEAQNIGQTAYAQFKAQNLPAAEAELQILDQKLDGINQTYSRLAFYSFVPLASRYYQDGQHGLKAADAGLSAGMKAVKAITPYADVLGFSGQGTFEGGTAEERVRLILQTLEKVTPVMDEISADLDTMETELAEINEKHYPESIRGRAIRSNIAEAKQVSAQASQLLTEFRPIIENLPSIAGANGQRRKYLVLFQNDNELRPTGGFLTAYSVIYIENGKVTPEKSDDIYELDKKFTKRLPIPAALGRYLTTEKYWNLRDMNTSPDFKISMDQFLEHYKEVKGEPKDIDGIIAIDTHVLTSLVKIVGPIEVPGYGTFTAENTAACDCPQIIYALSEIITKPTPYLREDRKGIIGPLMSSILQKLYSSPRTYMAQLFDTGLKSIEGRHLQMYFFDAQHQQAAEAINGAGRLDKAADTKDFLAIVNANLGGAKSNLFINYDVKQLVAKPENGQLTKTVEITYKNSRRGDNCNLEAGLLCLNSTLRDWTRLYIPAGSKLVSAQGFVNEPKEYEEAGFHVIDGFFILEPNSQAKVKVTYTIPYIDENTYSVELWKQGGVSPFETIMEVTGGEEKVLVDKDTVYTTEF